jgi:hypothetical protein
MEDTDGFDSSTTDDEEEAARRTLISSLTSCRAETETISVILLHYHCYKRWNNC